jgi:hypothetical protein
MSSLTINTPAAITQCQDTLIMWQGGIGKSPSRTLISRPVLTGRQNRIMSDTSSPGVLARPPRMSPYLTPSSRHLFGDMSLMSPRPSPAVSFQTDQNSQEWLCNVAAGVQITLTVQDSSGQRSYSSPVTIRMSSNQGSTNR